MEAIGAAASLVTLLATARGVFNDGYDLYKAIDDAPSELQSLILKANLVSSTLEQILALRQRLDDGDAQLLPLDLRMGLALSLQISYESLQKLKRLCSRTGKRGDLHLRLRWALLEKRAVQEIVKQLGKAENDLALILHLIHMRISLFQSTSIGVVLAAQDALSQDMDRIALNTTECLNRLTPSGRIEEVNDDNPPPVTAQISAQEQGSPGAVEEDNAEIVPFLRQGRDRSLRTKFSGRGNGWLQRLGISGTRLWYWDQHQSTYIMGLRSNLPAMFGHRALNFELAVRQYVLSWTNTSLLYGSIGISMIVPCTSEIYKACEEGDELTVRKLIDSRHASPNDRCAKCCCNNIKHFNSNENEPLLFAAVRSGNISLVRYLLDNGANVNSLQHQYLKSSLHVAFGCGLLDMARLLVNKGASLDHVDIFGRTVIHDLGFSRHNARQLKLEEAVEKWEHDVALPIVKYLGSMSFEDFDTPDYFQRRPLIQMASQGASNMCRKLLRYGAGPRGTRKTSHSEMLCCAASGVNTSIVTSILESYYPINLNTANSLSFFPPLHAAAVYGHTAVIELLLDKGAVVGFKNYDGRTALHEASEWNNMGVVKSLLERGADVNCTDNIGSTPLWYSLSSGLDWARRQVSTTSSTGRLLFPSSLTSNAILELSSCLLQYGADPHVLGWPTFGSFGRTGCLCTPTDMAKLAFGNEIFDIHVRVLAGHYTEIVVDTDRDVFWDAKEEITGEGYGCSYESEIGWQEYNKLLQMEREYRWKLRGERAA